MQDILNKIPAKKVAYMLLHKHLLIMLLLTPIVIGLTTFRTLGSIGESGNILQNDEVELAVPSFKPDQETLEKIQTLVDQEVEVAPEFQENRNNPFAN